MSLSRPTRDRLIAAAAALAIVIVAFGIVLLAKSCRTYTVTYYDGATIVRTEKVAKGEKATNKIPQGNKAFDCWLTEDGEEYDFSLPVEKNIKLYAKWQE